MSAPQWLSAPQIERADQPDGTILLRNRIPLPEPLPDILDRFDHWRAIDPQSVLITDRGGTHRATWSEIDASSDAAAAQLMNMGLGAGDIVVACVPAGIEHAILKLACLKQRVVLASLAPALLGSEHGRQRLRGSLKIARPKLLLSEAGNVPLLSAISPISTKDIAAYCRLDARARFNRPAHTPNDPAALFFTSGSTGEPKAVTITRAMIATNQAAYALHWPFLTQHRPVLLDWLPWHHVFGGLDNFFKMIWNGGEYHVDLPPSSDNIDQTATRLRTARPSIHINVPYGISLLLDRIATDEETKKAFFSRLDVIFFAGAGMNAPTWERLRATIATVAKPPILVSGYGMTEAGSTICLGLAPAEHPSEVGFPLPGHTLKLVPVETDAVSYEIRLRGPNVAPHYLVENGTAPLPTDPEGFLRTGDLATAAKAGMPECGLAFDGRLSEDFKLTTGTRVKAAALRHMLIEACAPDLADVAIAGEGQDRLAAILFVHGNPADPALAERLEASLARHNQSNPGSSASIHRAIIAITPPDHAAGEINDKGHLVQRRTLANRKAITKRLYDGTATDRIVIDLT